MPIHPRPSFAARPARIAAALCLLAVVAACNRPPSPTADETTQLFARALGEIDKLYVQPVSGQTLVVAGLAHLSAIDPQLRAAPGPGMGSDATLTLAYEGRVIGSILMPHGSDPEGLGGLVSWAIATDRSVSPTLAKTPEDVIDHAVFNGITGALDRFSRYSPPELAQELRAARNGYGGIGITLDTSNDEFRITALLPDAPAERAGIRAGDRLVAINGILTAKHSRAWVIEHLRGPVDSPIAVAVARSEPEHTITFDFRRAYLIRPTVTVVHDGHIVIFHIASFNQSTTERIAEALTKARAPADRIDGVVLDLRGDPGGLLEQAVSLADLFVDHGPIIATIGRNPASHQYFAASGHSIAPRVPIVVLINGGSASASEIVAAALQDTGRAIVIGSSSYGKGTVQTVIRLPNDGELTLTWAWLITPSGYLLQSHGVVPTLCTSGSDGAAATLPVALQSVRQLSARPDRARASLDEAGWQALRRACPPRHTSPPVDLALAEKLLSDTALYDTALLALPPASHLVGSVPGLPNEPFLTGLGPALFSGSH